MLQHTRGRSRRALLIATALFVALSLVIVTRQNGASAATKHTPVVFVHGFVEDGSMWATAKAQFKAAGYTDAELWAWTYNTSQSNVTTATQLSAYIDQVRASTGATKVDIVNHSMGGINSRYYLKFNGGAAKVRNWVSLAGANLGTSTAMMCALTTRSCQEMSPGSALLNKLNAAPSLPAGPSYYTFWTANDGIIVPATNTKLTGATNTQVSSGLSHLTIFKDATVLKQVLAIVNN